MSEQVGASSVGTPSHARRRLLILISGLAVLAVIVTSTVLLARRGNSAMASTPEVPQASTSEVRPTGGLTPATCPAQFELVEKPPAATRQGDLVPAGATVALLCSYSLRSSYPLPLGGVHTLTTNPDDLIGYLNGLPSSPPQEGGCLLGNPTEHVIVFGYQNRQPAVVHGRDCGWGQDGAIRYGGDIKKITGYWGVAWNQ